MLIVQFLTVQRAFASLPNREEWSSQARTSGIKVQAVFGKRKRQVVGCDIGSSAIKLVELKALKNGEYQLLHAAIAELSPEAIVDGAIMDSSLVVEALSRLIAENSVKSTGFGGSLSGHSVIIKKIQLPSMSESELTESIQWEAEQYIPFDINDVNLDLSLIHI